MTKIDAIILAGGKGTRLQSVVSDVPKPLAPVAGRPFLDYQFALLAETGAVRQAVLSIGHLADRIVEHYEASPPPIPVTFQKEDMPLGTGGGIRHALQKTSGEMVLALNGDSIFRWRLPPLIEAMQASDADCVMALVQVPDTSRYGSVDIDHNGVVTGFREKSAVTGPGLINAGLYLFSSERLSTLPLGESISLEKDIFPQLVEEGKMKAISFTSPFVDIGLPSTYAAAADILTTITEYKSKNIQSISQG